MDDHAIPGSLATSEGVDEQPRRVLVVDDDPEFRLLHAELMKGFGYEVEVAVDGVEALALMSPSIDLVILDGEMPQMDGFEVARLIRRDPEMADVPIVMVTGLVAGEDRLKAFDLGINDFVNKPVDAYELKLRARWLVSLKVAQDKIRDHSRKLEETVAVRTQDLRAALAEVETARLKTHEAHLDTIHRLTVAGEYKDRDTADHLERIGRFSDVVARWMKLPQRTVSIIRHAAPMHDVGKIGIPDAILLKPGKLNAEEWEVMQSHTTLGAEILANSASEVIQMGERIALSHHERWGGSGYPNGIAGEEIPLEARICAVVDFFDALTVDRPYNRKAVPREEVITMMTDASGSHFDPDILGVFLDAREEIHEVQATYFR